jgi:DNA-binding NtrC family response regulator
MAIMNSAPSILVVDDEMDTCQNLNDILTDLGYDVAIAENAFAALELIQNKRYDVALLDLMMPGMDGIELYRAIKERWPETVAFIVTGHPNNPRADEARASGIWGASWPSRSRFPACWNWWRVPWISRSCWWSTMIQTCVPICGTC